MKDETGKSIHFRSVVPQIRELCVVHASLRSHLDFLIEKAHELEANMPPGAAGIIATIKQSHWGRLEILIALEKWQKSTKNWGLHLQHLPELRGSSAEFDGGRKFTIKDRTTQGLGCVTHDSIPIVLIPVRSEFIEDSVPSELDQNEFDLDLASVLWFMTTHSDLLIKHRHHIEIVCPGEIYNEGEEIISVGLSAGTRIAHLRDPGNFQNCHRIIGVLPPSST